MWKNYFKVAWRSMLKQKLYSFINLLGLTIGMTCFILIALYIQYELGYDQFHENSEHIYRAYHQQPGNEYLGSDYFAVTPAGLGTALEEEIPEVQKATTFKKQNALISYQQENYYEKGLWADNQFFDIFSFSFLQGNPQMALESPKTIVLTQSFAQKMFGNENPIGKAVVYQDGDAFTVTGVVEDPPANSSIEFSYVTSILSDQQYIGDMQKDEWTGSAFHNFFVLSENANLDDFGKKLEALASKRLGYSEDYPFEDHFYFQPLHQLHLETRMNFDVGLKGNPQYIRLFSIIAIIVLLLACVNYMNLAIARSIKRAAEVGLRKVVGARRGQLIGQFLGESILITFLALLFALVLTDILSPIFGYLLERPIELNPFENPYLIPGLLLLVVIVGLISGSYPAFSVSALRPVHILKGIKNSQFSGMALQRWLTVGQYAVSIILIISSLVIYYQFQFIKNKDLGYDKDHILTIQIRDFSLLNKYEALRTEWLKNPQVSAVTASVDLPANIQSNSTVQEENENGANKFIFWNSRVDQHFLDVFGMQLVAGRFFPANAINNGEDNQYILNETAAQALGWEPEEAINKSFRDSATIVGVIRDFHMHSMYSDIEPLMLQPRQGFFNYISVKVRPENLAATISDLEESIAVHTPYPFEYQFLDERFDQIYKADIRLGEMILFFTILSILIASLGLFGLAVFMADQRTKEIGIRKVLGASIAGIVGMLSKDFLKMVLIAILIATPIAYYFMHQWLQDFAYRIEMQWWVFALAGILTIVIAFLTVSVQSVKAALANPVESLKNE